jgi:hypothetical protein
MPHVGSLTGHIALARGGDTAMTASAASIAHAAVDAARRPLASQAVTPGTPVKFFTCCLHDVRANRVAPALPPP